MYKTINRVWCSFINCQDVGLQNTVALTGCTYVNNNKGVGNFIEWNVKTYKSGSK